MNRRFRSLLLVSSALLIAPTSATASSPLLGAWPLDSSHEDGPDQVTADTSGNGLDLRAPNGSVHVGTPALFGTGALLGTNVTPLQVTSPLLAPAQVTLLAWIKQTGNPGTLRYIAGRGDDGAPTCSGSTYALYTGYPGQGGLHFYTRNGAAATGTSTAAPADGAVFDGRWHLVAGTFDGAATRLYIDGTLVGSPVPSTGPLNYALGGGTSFYVDGYPVAGCALANDADDWPGAIDEVRVYDRALTPTELGRLAAAPPGPSAPELVTDASLVPTPTPEPTIHAASIPLSPGTASPAAPAVPAAPRGSLADAPSLATGVGSVDGASKKVPSQDVQKAAAASQGQALQELRSADGTSQVSQPQPIKDLSPKQLRGLKPDDAIQRRLDSLEHGLGVEIPAAPGTVVEAVATLILEFQSHGVGKTVAVTLPASTAVAEPGKDKSVAGQLGDAQLTFEVDKKAEQALGNAKIANAALSLTAVTVDDVSDLGTTDQQKLQNAMADRSKVAESLNSLLKKLSDVNEAMTQNLKGGLTNAERSAQGSLQSKDEKLEKDIAKLEALRDQASQAASAAMAGATAQLVDGLLTGLTPVASAATGGKTVLPTATAALRGCNGSCPFEAAAK